MVPYVSVVSQTALPSAMVIRNLPYPIPLAWVTVESSVSETSPAESSPEKNGRFGIANPNSDLRALRTSALSTTADIAGLRRGQQGTGLLVVACQPLPSDR